MHVTCLQQNEASVESQAHTCFLSLSVKHLTQAMGLTRVSVLTLSPPTSSLCCRGEGLLMNRHSLIATAPAYRNIRELNAEGSAVFPNRDHTQTWSKPP